MLKLNDDTKAYEITPVELKLRDNDDSGNGLSYLNGKFSHRRPDIDVDTEDHLKLVVDYFHFSVTGTSALQAVPDLSETAMISLMPFYTYSQKKSFESTLRYFTTSAGWRGEPVYDRSPHEMRLQL